MTEALKSPAGVNTTSTLKRLLGKRRITPAQVAALRGSELGMGLRSLADAEAIFAIDRHTSEKCREWGDFLVETMLDFLVWDERPVGRLSEERALWLGDQVGDHPTPACLALLVAILEEAADVPAWFPPAVRVRARNVFSRPLAAAKPLAA